MMMISKIAKFHIVLLLTVCLLWFHPSQPGKADTSLFQGAARTTGFAVAVEGEYVYIAGEASNLAGSMPPGTLDLGGGMKDIWLAKLRTDGTPVYSALIGGSSDDSAYAVAVRQGVVYLLGETWSYDFPGAPGNAGESDAVLLALAADGSQVLWARRFGWSGQDAGRGLDIHAGSLYMTGVTWSDELASGGGLGLGDGFVARLGLDGALDWLQVFGGRTLDVPFGLSVADSGVWIAGQSFSTDFGGVQQGGGDAFVTRFSLGGVQGFANLYGGRSEDMAYGIALAGDGGVYLVGGSQSGGLTPAFGTYGGGFDGFLMKIATDGAVQSTSYLGGSSADYAHDVLPLPNGGALVVGVTFSQTFPLGYPRSVSGAGRSNAFIAHMQPSGDLADAWLVGGAGDDQALAAALTPQGLWLAGRFSTGPLGYALLVPPSGIPGVPLPTIETPQPTATLALTATPQPTETLRPTATPTLTFTPLPVTATFTAAAVVDGGAYPVDGGTVTQIPPDEGIDPTQALAITRAVAEALAQGTPAGAITLATEPPALTGTALAEDAATVQVSSYEGEGERFPTGWVVGGGLLLVAGLVGFFLGIRRKNILGELHRSTNDLEKPNQDDLKTPKRSLRKHKRDEPEESDKDLLL
jgi:hypothetical protein